MVKVVPYSIRAMNGTDPSNVTQSYDKKLNVVPQKVKSSSTLDIGAVPELIPIVGDFGKMALLSSQASGYLPSHQATPSQVWYSRV